MTEFEKFWRANGGTHDRDFAEKLWHAAQRAALSTIHSPPLIPSVGDKVRLLTLCHPGAIGQTREVLSVTKDKLDVVWMLTKTAGGELLSSGILGEIEVLKPNREETNREAQ